MAAACEGSDVTSKVTSGTAQVTFARRKTFTFQSGSGLTKDRIMTRLALLLATSGLAFGLAFGCDSNKQGASEPAKEAAPTPAAATTYTCPMHPEVTDTKPGRCPKCGMDLVPKK